MLTSPACATRKSRTGACLYLDYPRLINLTVAVNRSHAAILCALLTILLTILIDTMRHLKYSQQVNICKRHK